MRLNGTKYEEIEQLPIEAMAVSLYARKKKTAVGYIYIKYERFLNGKGSAPDYIIRCFKGSNYIIPV